MADISTAVSMARVPILGENGRISDDYIPAAIGENVTKSESAATRAESAATDAEGSASAASQSATQAASSASAAGASASKAQESAATASGAVTQAQSAQQAAEAAKRAAETAQSAAAQSAASVADKFIASAQATTLEPGSQATASVADQVLTIGVPKGEKGDAPTVGIGTVETLPAGSSATASATATDTGVNISFGIPKGEPGQDATLPEGTVVVDEPGILSSLGPDGEPSTMTDVSVVNTANGASAMMSASDSPNVSVVNLQTEAAVGLGVQDGEPVLKARKPQSGIKTYGFSPNIPEDDTLTVVTSDAYKADTDPLKQRITELEQQAQNVVTGTSTDLVSHAEDAFPQKPIEVRVKGKTWVNRWPVLSGTHNGITVATDETGLVTVTGTSTADADVTADVSGWAAGKSYTTMISATPTGCSAYFEVQKPSGNAHINATTTGATLNVTSDATNCVAGVHVTGGTTVNASFRVMLVDGTEAPDCFTPCASITSAQPENLVTSGKNLNNVIQSINKVSWATVTGSSENNSTWEDEKNGLLSLFNSLPEGTYRLTGKCTVTDMYVSDSSGEPSTNDVYGILVRYSGNTENPATTRKTTGVVVAQGTVLTIDQVVTISPSTSMGMYDQLYVYSPGADLGFRSFSDFTDLQLELGSTATSYEPPSVTTTALPEVELRSLPNGTCDELVIKADGTCEVERRTQLSGGDVTALPEPTTEPQSPVTLPALPAPTFNQYHDSAVPSDTSTEYVQDINIVLDNLAKQVAGTASAVAVREASTIEED